MIVSTLGMFALGLVGQANQLAALPTGITQMVINADMPILVYRYEPKNYQHKRLIVVLHGTNRNADEYCDHARVFGDKFGALVIAPKFDTERFPNWRYHRGGILDAKEMPQQRSDWTFNALKKIIKRVQLDEGPLKYWLIGHSAGGQFLNRMCAFDQDGAEGIIVANPGSVVFPRTDWEFAYGLGKLPGLLGSKDAVAKYLSQPMTFLCGTADNKPDEYFDKSAPAMRQGGGRYQRAHNCFEFGKQLAREMNVPFGWRIVDVEGVGHSDEKMFAAQNIGDAFKL